MLAARERAELAVDEGNDLAREIVRVIAARGEAVRKDDDRRSHFSLADKPRRALRDVVAERLPVGVRETRAGEADEVVEHREAFASAVIVLRRQPHAELAHVRIAQGVVLENLGDVLQHDQRAGGAFRAFEGHGVSIQFSNHFTNSKPLPFLTRNVLKSRTSTVSMARQAVSSASQTIAASVKSGFNSA